MADGRARILIVGGGFGGIFAALELAGAGQVTLVGGVTNYAHVEGAEEHTLPFRTLADADALRNRMIDTLDRIPPDAAPQDARAAATFVVVGAGASGIELSTKMADLLHDAFRRRGLHGEARVVVLEMGAQILPGMGADLREYVEGVLRETHIEVHTETRVRRVTPQSVVFEHAGEQTELPAAAIVWVGGVRTSPLIEHLNLPK